MPSDKAPEPAMASRAALVDFFSRGLAAFQSSKDAFRVVCTLSRRSLAAAAGRDDIAATPVPRPPREERPPRRVRNLVVLDSSFNPPTLAHLRMAVSAVRDLQRGRHKTRRLLLLLLAVNNADKKPKPAAFPVRLGMMHAFAQDLLDELRGQALSAPGMGEGAQEHEAAGGGAGEIDVDLGLTTMPYFHDKSQAISDERFYAVDGEGPEQVYLAGYDTLIRIFNPKYYNVAAPSPSTTTTEDGREGAEVVAPIRGPWTRSSRGLGCESRCGPMTNGATRGAGCVSREAA
ncbi:LOW QUALITY PROTEIN: cytidylyltransferase family protein [Colletotrichum tofieldiae]|nr:LOW QUALITY PROTEIN: cytidylyltransferase family protein [Colletotrichum tofieldiae]